MLSGNCLHFGQTKKSTCIPDPYTIKQAVEEAGLPGYPNTTS